MNESPEQIRETIKKLIIERLHIEGLEMEALTDDASLTREIGLDSVDALELAVAIEREFGIKIVNSGIGEETFRSVATLADFVVEQRQAQAQN